MPLLTYVECQQKRKRKQCLGVCTLFSNRMQSDKARNSFNKKERNLLHFEKVISLEEIFETTLEAKGSVF